MLFRIKTFPHITDTRNRENPISFIKKKNHFIGNLVLTEIYCDRLITIYFSIEN